MLSSISRPQSRANTIGREFLFDTAPRPRSIPRLVRLPIVILASVPWLGTSWFHLHEGRSGSIIACLLCRVLLAPRCGAYSLSKVLDASELTVITSSGPLCPGRCPYPHVGASRSAPSLAAAALLPLVCAHPRSRSLELADLATGSAISRHMFGRARQIAPSSSCSAAPPHLVAPILRSSSYIGERAYRRRSGRSRPGKRSRRRCQSRSLVAHRGGRTPGLRRRRPLPSVEALASSIIVSRHQRGSSKPSA